MCVISRASLRKLSSLVRHTAGGEEAAARVLKDPRYPQNKIYRTVYKEGLSTQQEAINKRIIELDTLIATKSGISKTIAETEKITRNDDLKKIEELNNKLRQEKKRIKKFLK